MVKVRDSVPALPEGGLDIDRWAAELARQQPHLDAPSVVRACEFVRGLSGRGERYLERGVELANLVASLQMDTPSVLAALLYGPTRNDAVDVAAVRSAFGDDVAHLVEDVARMATASLLEMTNAHLQTSEARDQVENIRRLLVSLIDDARVAVLKLAERVVALRAAKGADEARQLRIAQEAHQIFAPLANRMGIWRLKWELEDLSLRYLAPDAYKVLARQLDGRREERENQVAEIAALIETTLRDKGIGATVGGRAKHIFSIWRKMRHKNVPLNQVYDVRAVRVLVPDIAQCYAALGIIHTQWQHIPREFDDYIAVPKENGYRSIHTAVMGPDGKTLEVQIRTQEMHDESELGVCAHWSYKDGRQEDRTYAEKMNWLRQVVEWQKSLSPIGSRERLSDELRHRVSEERIFVSTPKGHVLDLTSDATPLDFAYRVHTEVGHRCQRAIVDGTETSLNTPLQTGQQVEIVTGDELGPRREWLETHLGFVQTARAKEKIQDWFRARSKDENLALARKLLAQLIRRLSLAYPSRERLLAVARAGGYVDEQALLLALAVGDCQLVDLIDDLYPSNGAAATQLSLLPETSRKPAGTFIIEIEADDRDGLLRDVVMLLSAEHVAMVANSGSVDPGTSLARIRLEVNLFGIAQLARVIEKLRCVADVRDVYRTER